MDVTPKPLCNSKAELDKAGVSRLPGETGAQLSTRAKAELPDHDSLIARLALSFSKLRFEPIPDTRKATIRTQLKRDMKKLAAIARRSKTKRMGTTRLASRPVTLSECTMQYIA